MSVVNPILSIGMQNVSVLKQISTAYSAALNLAEDGYTVLEVSIGQGIPVITITECDACKHLKGIKTTLSLVSRTAFMVSAEIPDCLVQWACGGSDEY